MAEADIIEYISNIIESRVKDLEEQERIYRRASLWNDHGFLKATAMEAMTFYTEDEMWEEIRKQRRTALVKENNVLRTVLEEIADELEDGTVKWPLTQKEMEKREKKTTGITESVVLNITDLSPSQDPIKMIRIFNELKCLVQDPSIPEELEIDLNKKHGEINNEVILSLNTDKEADEIVRTIYDYLLTFNLTNIEIVVV